MIRLLRKIFIKNYKKTDDPKVRQKHGFLASFVGIISNLLLVAFKLTIGILIFSMSIITDALNNLTDAASSVVNLFGFRLAGKPADKEHPFGHERIEYIAGLIISFIVITIAVVLGYTSVMKIISNQLTDFSNNVTTIVTFVILAVAILTKIWQSYFYRHIGKIIDSISLKASSQDSLNDVISTSAVLIAMIVEYILYINGIKVNIDGWVGLAVSIFIVITGIKLMIEASNPLIGQNPDNKLVNSIVKDIESYDGVLGVHDMMWHSYGPTKIFMTIHVEVDYRTDVMVSHDLIDNIEKEIAQKFNILLTIHMDPVINDSPEINLLKDKTALFLKEYNQGELLSFHDFRIVSGPTHTNILFDVVIPFECQVDKSELLNYLQSRFTSLNDSYFLVINFDNKFVN